MSEKKGFRMGGQKEMGFQYHASLLRWFQAWGLDVPVRKAETERFYRGRTAVISSPVQSQTRSRRKTTTVSRRINARSKIQHRAQSREQQALALSIEPRYACIFTGCACFNLV